MIPVVRYGRGERTREFNYFQQKQNAGNEKGEKLRANSVFSQIYTNAL